MKSVLTALLSLWFVAAPAVCGAVCWTPATASDALAAHESASSSMPSCHPGEREPARGSSPEPVDGDDCCDSHDASEIGPLPTDAAQPNPPASTLALASGPAPSHTDLGAANPTRSAVGDSLRSPYRHANPPLLN
jgi:hypothetical protein